MNVVRVSSRVRLDSYRQSTAHDYGDFTMRPLRILTVDAFCGAWIADEQVSSPPDIQSNRKDSSLSHSPKGRFIIIGDIHGCAEEFHLLLQKLQYKPPQDSDSDLESDILFLAGDLVGKGANTDSFKLVQQAHDGCFMSVMGNHEAGLLNTIHRLQAEEEKESKPHLNADGQGSTDQPALSEGNNAEDLARAFLEDSAIDYRHWLASLPHIIHLPLVHPESFSSTHHQDILAGAQPIDHIVIVHAGLNPCVPLWGQGTNDVMNMRRLVSKPLQPDHADCDDVPFDKLQADRTWVADERWLSYWDGRVCHNSTWTDKCEYGQHIVHDFDDENNASQLSNCHVVFGHDASTGLRDGVQLNPHGTGLDTGCVYGGELSALVLAWRRELDVDGHPRITIDSREIVSVPAVRMRQKP